MAISMYRYSSKTFLLFVASATVLTLHFTAGATQERIAVRANKTFRKAHTVTNVGYNDLPYVSCNEPHTGVHCIGGFDPDCVSDHECTSLTRFQLTKDRVLEILIAGHREKEYFKAAAFYPKQGRVGVDQLEAIVFRANIISLNDTPLPTLEMYAYYIDANGTTYPERNMSKWIVKRYLADFFYLLEVEMRITTFTDDLGTVHDLINDPYYLTIISASSDNFTSPGVLNYANQLPNPVTLSNFSSIYP